MVRTLEAHDKRIREIFAGMALLHVRKHSAASNFAFGTKKEKYFVSKGKAGAFRKRLDTRAPDPTAETPRQHIQIVFESQNRPGRQSARNGCGLRRGR
jgi:hypothetical protein